MNKLSNNINGNLMEWRAGEDSQQPIISGAYVIPRQLGPSPSFNDLQDGLSKQSTLSRHASPAHKRAARMLGFALTLGDEASWWDFAAVIFLRLSRKERVALAYFALMSLEENEARTTAEAAVFGYVEETNA